MTLFRLIVLWTGIAISTGLYAAFYNTPVMFDIGNVACWIIAYFLVEHRIHKNVVLFLIFYAIVIAVITYTPSITIPPNNLFSTNYNLINYLNICTLFMYLFMKHKYLKIRGIVSLILILAAYKVLVSIAQCDNELIAAEIPTFFALCWYKYFDYRHKLKLQKL